MPEMIIRIEGTGGAFADVFRRGGRVIEMPHDIPLRVETLDEGMTMGAPAVSFIIELPQQRMLVLAQTSLKLFQLAAAVTMGKYGDMTAGGLQGFVEGDTADLRLSTAVDCPRCRRPIPGSCKYCPECGAKL